jgi:hypothetical protein
MHDSVWGTEFKDEFSAIHHSGGRIRRTKLILLRVKRFFHLEIFKTSYFSADFGIFSSSTSFFDLHKMSPFPDNWEQLSDVRIWVLQNF